MQKAALVSGQIPNLLRAGGQAVQSLLSAAQTAHPAGTQAYSTAYTFSSPQDAPPPSGSSLITLSFKGGKGKTTTQVDVSGPKGKASAKVTSDAASFRSLQAQPLALVDATRTSVLHCAFTEYLLKLVHERYTILASWPDFTTAFGKDIYYRAHPEDLRKFYALVDEFHRAYDVLTEFGTLTQLGSELQASYKAKRLNVLHPAISPTPANGVVAQFLLAPSK